MIRCLRLFAHPRFAGFFLLVAALAFGAAEPSRADAPPPWVVGEVRIMGSGLTVSPASQPVPLNVATVVNTLFGDGSTSAPESWRVRAVLEGPDTGPKYYDALVLETVPNRPFQIPPIPIAGRYLLKDIRLMDGDTVLSESAVSPAEINVSKILVSSITSRPMTWEEIQASGTVINPSDYKGYRITVGLGLSSGEVTLDLPVLFNASDPTAPPIVLSKESVPGPPPLPQAGWPTAPPTYSIGEIPTPIKFDIPPEVEIPELSLSGLLVFPTGITFLNQFIAVGLVLQNGAPQGTVLQFDSMTATIHFPNGSNFVIKNMIPEGLGATAPILNAGQDRVLGTPDDVSVLAAGMMGQSEFDVSTAKPGTYRVDIAMNGQILGLPGGEPVPIHGTATGVVVVRDPTFHVTFAHPAVVRQLDEYVLKVTVTNTSPSSTDAANQITVKLPQSGLSGARLLDTEVEDHFLGNLRPGESATTEYKLLALRTGTVTATSIGPTESNVQGSIVLSAGIGDGGIPLSSQSLVLPPVVTEQFPPSVVDSALTFLGLGWSLATAPPDKVPGGMAQVSESVVRSRANDLTEIARCLSFATPETYGLSQALAEMSLRWLGNAERDTGFDALRRLPPDALRSSKGLVFAETLGGLLVPQGTGILEAHASYAAATRTLNPHFSVAVGPGSCATAPRFRLADAQGHILGDDESGALRRDLPWGERYPFGAGSLFAVGHLAGDTALSGSADGFCEGTADLSICAPLAEGVTLLQFHDIPVHEASRLRLGTSASSGAITVEIDSLGNGSYVPLLPSSSQILPLPALTVLGAARDLAADQTGRAIAVFFNRPLDAESAWDASHFTLDRRLVKQTFLQQDRRIVEVRADSRLSTLVQNNLTVSGVKAEDGSPMNPSFVRFPISAGEPQPAGTVHGIVYGEDGAPLPGADVYLYETDVDLLKKYDGPGELEGGLVEHVTQHVTTGPAGDFFLDYVMVNGRSFLIEARQPGTRNVATLRTILKHATQDIAVALFMRARGSVAGRVFDPDGVTPAPGVLVTATEVTTGEYVQGRTDSFGAYQIDRIPVGTVRLLAQKPKSNQRASATARVLSAGSTARANLYLVDLPQGAVRGQVVEEGDGSAVAGALVRATGENCSTSVFANLDGTFALSGITAGSASITVHDPVTHQLRFHRDGYFIPAGGSLDLYPLAIPAVSQLEYGTVTGTVLGPSGSGASEIPVYLARGDAFLQQVQTDTQGVFAFGSGTVPVGEFWTITAYDPTTRRTASVSVRLLYSGQTMDVVLRLPGSGSISGRVSRFGTSGSVEAAPYVPVFLDGPSGTMTTTRADGSYTFTGAPVGSHRVIAVPQIPDAGSAPADIGSALASILFDGQAAIGADIQMLGHGDLDLTVLIRGTNGGPDVPVMALVYAMGQKISPDTWTLLDDEAKTDYSNATTGKASFHGLLGTQVFVGADDVINGRVRQQVQVKSGDTLPVVLYLEQTGSVQGTVFASDGVTPVPHALVNLVIAGLPPQERAALADGTFHFDLVKLGRVTVEATDSLTGLTGSASGLVTGSQAPLHMDVVLKGEGRILGLVLEDDGTGNWIPSANAAVKILDQKGKLKASAVTDAIGQFLFEGVQEGSYAVEALSLSHQFPLSGRTTVTVTKNETAEVTARLGQFGTVVGTLVMPDGMTPVDNAQISFFQGQLWPSGFAATDTEGRFQFDFVPVSTMPFTLSAFDPRTGRSDSKTGHLTTPGEVVTVPLVLSGVGSLYGTVTNFSGTVSVSYPRVVASGDQGDLSVTGGQDGTYTFPGMAQGTYLVLATDPVTKVMGHNFGTIRWDGYMAEVPIAIPLGVIEGTVFHAGGQTVVPGALIQIALGGPRAVADNLGHYSIHGVSMGSHQVFASDPNGPDTGVTDVTVGSDSEPIPADVTLLGLGTVSGTVQGAPGEIARGFQVVLRDHTEAGLRVYGPIWTDSNGDYEFQDVLVGHIAATAQAPSGSGDSRKGTAEEDLIFNPLGETHLILPVVLSAAGTVQGFVTDEQGNFLSGAQVKLAKTSPWTQMNTGTDESGFFRFPVIPVGTDGTFTISVTGPAGGHGHATGILADGQILNMGTIILDTIPPTLLSSDPADQSRGVAKTITPTFTFSEALDPATINSATVKMAKASTGQLLVFTRTLSEDGLTLTLTPSQTLESQTDYSVTLSKSILDLNGNPMAADVIIQFKTLDDIPPTAEVVEPANNAVEVSQEAYPFVILNEVVDSNSLANGSFVISTSGLPMSREVQLVEDDSTHEPPEEPKMAKLLFVRNGTFAQNAMYTMTVSGYTDEAGNPMVPVSTTFYTEDTYPPAIDISGVTEGGQYTQAVTPQISVADLHLAPGSPTITLNGQTYINGTLVSQEGDYILEVSAEDMSSHVSHATANFTIDKQPPTITIGGVAEGVVYQQPVTPLITVADPHLNPSSVSATLNGQAYESGTPVDQDGMYTLSVTASDTLNQSRNITTQFTLDSAPPTVVLSRPDIAIPGSPVVLTVSGADSASLVKLTCSISGAFADSKDQDYPPGTTSAEKEFVFTVPSSAPDGSSIDVNASATDAAGHVAYDAQVQIPVCGDYLPSVRVTSPISGAHLPKGGQFTAEAQAQVTRGTITSVSFMLDEQPVATIAATPYEAGITLPLSGTASVLTASATTNCGKSATSSPVAIILDPSARITGHVYQSRGLDIEPGANVTIKNKTTGQIVKIAVADTEGFYDTGYIKLGEYTLIARKADGTDGAVADLPPAQDSPIPIVKDLTLTGTGTIAGRVVDGGTSVSLENARIHLYGKSTLPQTMDVYSAAGGVFTIPDVLAGPYTLSAYHPSNQALGFQVDDSIAPDELKSYDPLRCYSDAAAVVSFSPAPNSTEVETGAPVSITFSRPVTATTLNAGITVQSYALPFKTGVQYLNDSWSLSTDGLVATMTLPARSPQKAYHISVLNVRDTLGRTVFPADSWFSTRTPPQPLLVTFIDRATGNVTGTVEPPQTARNVPGNVTMQVLFDQEIDPVTVNDYLLALFPSSGGVIYGTVSLLADQKTLEFTPSLWLATDSRFQLFLYSGLRDLQGDVWYGGLTLSTLYTQDTKPPLAQILYPPDQGRVLDGAYDLPVRHRSQDGDNYCGTLTTTISVDGVQSDIWTGAACTPWTSLVDLPVTDGQPVLITQRVTDEAGFSTTSQITLAPVTVSVGQETPYAQSTGGGQIATAANRAYVGRSLAVEIYEADPVNLSAPQLLGSVSLGGSPVAMQAAGRYLWILLSNNKFEGYDIANPAVAAKVCSVDIPACGQSYCYRKLAVSGGYAYYTDSGTVLHILSLANPNSPVEVKTLAFGYSIDNLQVQGPVLLVNSGGYIRLYDASDPRAPYLLNSYFTSYTESELISDALLEGDRLYLKYNTDYEDGLAIVDVSNPVAPILEGRGYDIWRLSPGLRDGDFLLASGGPINVRDAGQPYSAGWYRSINPNGLGRTGDAITITTSTGVRTVKFNQSHAGSSLAIVSPKDGSYVSKGAQVAVAVSPNAGFDGSASLWVNGEPAGTCGFAPYQFTYWVPYDAPGSLLLEATLVSDAGQTIHSDLVTLLVSDSDVTPPTAHVYEPSGQSVVGGDTGVWAWATDNVGVTGKTLMANGTPVAWAPGQSSPDWAALGSAGQPFGSDISLQLQAVDAAGNVGISQAVHDTFLFDASVSVFPIAAEYGAGEFTLSATESRIAVTGPVTRLFDRGDLVNPIAQDSCPSTKVVMTNDLAVSATPDEACGFISAGGSGSGGILSLSGKDVAADGALACVISTSDQIQVYDVTGPAEPLLLSEFSTNASSLGTPKSIWLSGSTLLVYTQDFNCTNMNLVAFDLADPSNPVLQGAIPEQVLGGGFLAGHHLITQPEGAIVDIADPANMTHVGSVPAYRSALDPVGGSLLLASRNSCYDTDELYDLRDPSSPVLMYASQQGGAMGDFSCGWSATAASGSHVLRAAASSDPSQYGELKDLFLDIHEATPPVAVILSPSEGETVNTARPWWVVRAGVSDDLGIAWVDLYVNGARVQRKSFGPWNFLLALDSSLVGMPFTIEMRATDLSGNVATATVNAQFGTEAVHITLTPSGEATEAAGTSVDLAADAVMAGGVDRVEFVVDGTVICADAEKPYTCTLALDESQIGQTLTVDAIAYHGSESLSTASDAGSLVVHVVATIPNSILAAVPLSSPAWWMEMSHEGTYAALSNSDGLWIVSTSDFAVPLVTLLTNWCGYIRPDGETMVVATTDPQHSREVYSIANLADGTPTRSYEAPSSSRFWPTLSRDGRTLAFVDQDYNVTLLDLETMQSTLCCNLIAEAHLSPDGLEVWGAAFTGDGKGLVLTAGNKTPDDTYQEPTLLRLNLETLEWAAQIALPAMGGPVISPDGTKVWIVWAIGVLAVVDIASGEVETYTGFPGKWGFDLSFHPSGEFCSAVDWEASVFDVGVESPGIIPGHTVSIHAPDQVVFEPHGRWSYVPSSTDSVIYKLFVAEEDTWPPRLIATIPSEGGMLEASSPYVMYLSEPMSEATINAATVLATADADGSQVEGDVVSLHSGTVVWWSPRQALPPGNYTVTLSGLLDEAGNPLPAIARHFVAQ